MKYIWEENDITPGRIITSKNKSENVLICSAGSEESTFDRYFLVFLKNGALFASRASKENLATYLNFNGYLPTDLR